ncbi:MAG: hypothetical protein AB1599_01150 [Planctomycetota bacterium]
MSFTHYTDESLQDEQLVESYRSGENSALDTLFSRYLSYLLAFLSDNSFFSQDRDYLLEVRDEIFLKACEGLRRDPKDGGFASKGPGSFSAWLFAIAKLEILNADKKRRRLHIPFSHAFPPSDDQTNPEENILFRTNLEPDETEYARMKLERAFKGLKPDEVKLLQLSVRMKYKDILKLPEYSQYKSVDSISKKVYRITEKIRATDKRR